ncbi:tigger transposable element-derived protein 6-like [Ixodes scapularis]|uniref:tigger transposable element-derived protein 6-like n=1 Tax=Ixodes scapularis TaxID=6945 RepID=UPI001C393FA1|nr:tigger transposable element-derived protein 6-like [Ixodes scapularis]
MAPTKRKAISLEVKQRIHRDFRQGFKVGSLAKRYEPSQSTISTIIKAGDVLKKAGTSGHDDQRKRVRDPLYGDVEDSLYQWFLTTRNRNVPISGPILAAKAKKFASLLGRENFEPGGGWIQRFKDRHGIVYKNVVGEAASLDVNAKDEWLATKLPELLERFQESDIFNGDETALFYEMLPTKTHALKGDPCVGGKHSKVRVTVFVCANMDGTERLKPFVIGKSKRPHCFRNQCIPVRYRNNKKAWMTRDLFEEWLLEFDGAMEKQKRKVVLLLDNCSAHNVSPKLTSVEVMFLPPNTTAGLQPMDAGVIANFKALYRRRMLEWLIMKLDCSGLSQYAGGPPDLKVSLLEAVRFVHGAWYEVKQVTLKNCFKKAGFVRHNATVSEETNDLLIEPADVGELWDHIAASEENIGGALLGDFLNADNAAASCEESTDEAIAEEQQSRRKITSSDCESSDDDGGDENTPPPMSSQNALLSIQSLVGFVHAKGLPPAYAQQLEAMHTAIVKLQLKQAQISDFFKHA